MLQDTKQFPGAKLVYGGAGSRPGDFDLVFRYVEKGEVKYVIVEAKGGSAGVGTKRVEGVHVEQGHPSYFDAIAVNMENEELLSGSLKQQEKTLTAKTAKGEINVGAELREAKVQDRVRYIMVQAPVEPDAGKVALVTGFAVKP